MNTTSSLLSSLVIPYWQCWAGFDHILCMWTWSTALNFHLQSLFSQKLLLYPLQPPQP